MMDGWYLNGGIYVNCLQKNFQTIGSVLTMSNVKLVELLIELRWIG